MKAVLVCFFLCLTTFCLGCNPNDCVAAVIAKLDSECQPYRSMMPRPALYTRCLDAFGAGARIGCKEYCGSGKKELQSIHAQGHQHCYQWGHGYERAYLKACLNSFGRGVVLAVNYEGEHPDTEEEKNVFMQVKDAVEEETKEVVETKEDNEEEGDDHEAELLAEAQYNQALEDALYAYTHQETQDN